jgi:hypothetical protein
VESTGTQATVASPVSWLRMRVRSEPGPPPRDLASPALAGERPEPESPRELASPGKARMKPEPVSPVGVVVVWGPAAWLQVVAPVRARTGAPRLARGAVPKVEGADPGVGAVTQPEGVDRSVAAAELLVAAAQPGAAGRSAAAAELEAAGRDRAGPGRGAAVRAGHPGPSRSSRGSAAREARQLGVPPPPAPGATPWQPCSSWSGGARPGPPPPPEQGRNHRTGGQRGTGTQEAVRPPSPQSVLAAVDPWTLVCQARPGVTAINRSCSSCRTAGRARRCRPAGCRLFRLMGAGPRGD